MIDLICETDLGRDLDDLIALLYFGASRQINLRAILLSPGSVEQVVLARTLFSILGITALVGVPQTTRDKDMRCSDIHRQLIEKYGRRTTAVADGFGWEIAMQTLMSYPSAQLFICGPPLNTRELLRRIDAPVQTPIVTTLQGGFVGYSVHSPSKRLEKFEGKDVMPSFNFDANPAATDKVLSSPLLRRRIVGKQLCHSILYNVQVHAKLNAAIGLNPRRESKLLVELMSIYLTRHGCKRLHDPLAALCHLQPEIGLWIRGKSYRRGEQWGTKVDECGDLVLVDLDFQAFWTGFISAFV